MYIIYIYIYIYITECVAQLASDTQALYRPIGRGFNPRQNH